MIEMSELNIGRIHARSNGRYTTLKPSILKKP